jgi:hypothetical protein
VSIPEGRLVGPWVGWRWVAVAVIVSRYAHADGWAGPADPETGHINVDSVLAAMGGPADVVEGELRRGREGRHVWLAGTVWSCYHINMDTKTSGAVARDLGVTVARVHRVVVRLGLEPRHRGNRLRFSAAEVRAIAGDTGQVVPSPELRRVEGQILCALSHHPLGLCSARAVARAAQLSPTVAARLLPQLEVRGLVEQVVEQVVAGRVTELRLWRVRFTGSAWRAVAPQVARMRLPDAPVRPRPPRLPRRLHHLFWNDPAPERINLREDASMVAQRLLNSNDPQALAWAAGNLSTQALRRAGTFRNTPPEVAALGVNL